jgi:hypothetical protein
VLCPANQEDVRLLSSNLISAIPLVLGPIGLYRPPWCSTNLSSPSRELLYTSAGSLIYSSQSVVTPSSQTSHTTLLDDGKERPLSQIAVCPSWWTHKQTTLCTQIRAEFERRMHAKHVTELAHIRCAGQLAHMLLDLLHTTRNTRCCTITVFLNTPACASISL